MFCNVNFSSFENFLQRKQKTGRTRESIFRASGGTNFEHFSGFGFDGCAILPNVYIYMYIYIHTTHTHTNLYIYTHIHIYIYIYIYININVIININPLSANPIKRPNTLKKFVGKLPTNCLSVFGHFVNLALKGLILTSVTGKTVIKPVWIFPEVDFFGKLKLVSS